MTNRLSSWGSEYAKKNCCSWEGVYCSYETGHVLKLDLQAWDNPTLRGKISPSLGNLTRLQYLSLSWNDFIIVENLEWLSHLVSIKYLSLREVNLSVFHDWLKVVSRLPKLSVLYLADCDLPPITPSSLKDINSTKSLTHLDLSENPRITSSIFPWLYNSSTNLASLDLSSNQLQGSIPNAFGNMNSLEQLILTNNRLEGHIPKSFGDIFGGLIFEMLQVGSRFPKLDKNSKKPFRPRCLLVNTMVRWKGNVYEYGKNFGKMRSIDLANNKLSGKIPEEISSLIELKALNLSRNMLTGKIPQKIGQLEQLESLDLSRNQFFGSIPASMANLHFLGYLDLSYNKFSGKIPTGTQLQSFDPLKFIGNIGLCGPPLIEKCPGDVTSNTTTNGGSKSYQQDGDEFWKCLYAGLVVCDNGSAHCKIAKDVSQLKATAIPLKEILGLRYYMIFFFLGTHAMV
uniref:Leucine-rich repeat-containing N-terminal plant-type domain-containing protein n=1 Tax=Fagus sylvatica TaxID=28930 RepID=A0A2N9GLS6_FAGSY